MYIQSIAYHVTISQEFILCINTTFHTSVIVICSRLTFCTSRPNTQRSVNPSTLSSQIQEAVIHLVSVQNYTRHLPIVLQAPIRLLRCLKSQNRRRHIVLRTSSYSKHIGFCVTLFIHFLRKTISIFPLPPQLQDTQHHVTVWSFQLAR